MNNKCFAKSQWKIFCVCETLYQYLSYGIPFIKRTHYFTKLFYKNLKYFCDVVKYKLRVASYELLVTT